MIEMMTNIGRGGKEMIATMTPRGRGEIEVGHEIAAAEMMTSTMRSTETGTETEIVIGTETIIDTTQARRTKAGIASVTKIATAIEDETAMAR